MTAIELKEFLINKIREIDDISFLNAIKTILNDKTESQQIRLTAEQKEEIRLSREDIRSGNVIDATELENNFKAWLKAE